MTPDQVRPAAAPVPTIRPNALLWLLAGFGFATLIVPSEIVATLHHLRMPDRDDAMRLVEVRDLVNGQGWYDLTQHRFAPPAGIVSHWSRFVDAPIAGLILLLTPLMGRPLAEGLTAALWPPMLFCLYAAILYRGAKGLFGPRAALLALVVAPQTVGLTLQFAVGRIDHHGIQLTIILGLALAIARGGARAGLCGGVLAALSLAVGLEGLPTVAVGALFLCGDWVLRGRAASATLTGFGLGLGVAAPLLFAAQTDPARWGITACDALSPPWLFLAAVGLAASALCEGVSRTTLGRGGRFAVLAVLGAGAAAGFAVLFPSCLAGPFAGMSELVREHWLLKVSEMTSARTFLVRGQWEALVFYPALIIATVAATLLARESRAWAVIAVLLWPGLIVGLIEVRGIYVASGLIPLAAGAFIDRALATARETGVPPWRRQVSACAAAGLVSSVWMVPAALGNALLPGLRTAPAAQADEVCLTDEALRDLASLPPGTVLAPIFMGPAILLQTHHAVVAAPYHRAVPQIAAALEGLGGTEDDLRRAVETQRATYVAVCAARLADDLQAEPAFATRLAHGDAKADWLTRLPSQGPVMVWRAER